MEYLMEIFKKKTVIPVNHWFLGRLPEKSWHGKLLSVEDRSGKYIALVQIYDWTKHEPVCKKLLVEDDLMSFDFFKSEAAWRAAVDEMDRQLKAVAAAEEANKNIKASK